MSFLSQWRSQLVIFTLAEEQNLLVKCTVVNYYFQWCIKVFRDNLLHELNLNSYYDFIKRYNCLKVCVKHGLFFVLICTTRADFLLFKRIQFD